MIDAGELNQRIRQAFSAIYNQSGRLVTIESALGPDALVVERLSGREAISECFQFEVDCVAPSAQFELKTLIGEPLTLRLKTPYGSRVWHGYATRASMLGSDGGMARYRVVLSPWLTFLAQRRNVLIFQDKTALEIIEAVFADYPQANYATDVTQTLLSRPRCTQYRETDLAFVERLLAEEGLCYRFVHDADQSAADSDEDAPHGPTLYITDRQADVPDVAPAAIRFHRVSQVEADDGITAFRKQARLTPNAATLSAWDAMKLRAHAHQAEQEDKPDLPPLELYDGARAGLRHQQPAEVERSTDQRLAAARLQADTASGASSARQMAAGNAFTLTEHASDNGRYVLWAVEHRAANNLGAHLAHLMGQADIESGSYRNHFVCAPDTVDVVPVNTGKPLAPGPETAQVVGVADQALTSTRDHGVKVQFPWQRGEVPNRGGLTETHSQHNPDGNAPGDERNGTWVRVSETIAGPNWGAAFVPRIGTEVLIDYLEGDIDQPMIVGQFYNGTDAPPFAAGADSAANHPGTIAGTHTHALDNSGHNQWAHDDAPGQLRQRMATSQAASELNLGYLIDQNGATRGAYRGQGAELQTGGWAALRAPQGLLLSTTARQRGDSTPHDVAESVGQLKAAHDLADRLSSAAATQQASGLEANSAQADFTQTLDPEADGVYQSPVGGQDHHKANPGSRDAGDPAERFATPSILLDSTSTLATTTPASSLLYAGGNTHMTIQGEAQHSASATYSQVSGATTSLYTHDGGLQGVAANGALSLQAHDDTLEILADDSITTSSSQTRVDMLANSKIVLTAGQSTVTLEGSKITFACPGTFTVKGGAHNFVGPAGQAASQPPLPTGTAHAVKAAFNGSANPFVQPAQEDESEHQHSECDYFRIVRDATKNNLDLLIAQQQVFLGSDVAGDLLDAASVHSIGKKMVTHYGQFGLGRQAEARDDVANFLGEKVTAKGSGTDGFIEESRTDSLTFLKSAKQRYDDASQKADQCEASIVARRQAAAEQEKISDAMDFLKEKNALERDISTLTLAASLTSSGAQLTHQDFEYQNELLMSQGDETERTAALQNYNGAPNWDWLSQSAQRATTHLTGMVPSNMRTSETGVMVPPPDARESILENLRTKRDAIESYYDQELKPIWSQILDYWTTPSSGVI